MPWHDGGFLDVDIHVHSVASGHAFGTVSELLTVANQRKIQVLGLAEHGPSMAGAPHEGYFTMRDEIAAWPTSTRLLFGCEANILDTKGELDLPSRILNNLDFVIAGLHSLTPYDRVENCCSNNTKASLATIASKTVDVLAHPLHQRFDLDLADVVAAAADFGVALELNARLLRDPSPELLEQHYLFLSLVRRYGAPILLASDSHIPPTVGDVGAINVLGKDLADLYPQIVNGDAERFWNWLTPRRTSRAVRKGANQ